MYSFQFKNQVIKLSDGITYAGIEYSDSFTSKQIQNFTYKKEFGVKKEETASHAFVICQHPKTLIWYLAESHINYGGLYELPIHQWINRKNKDKNRVIEIWSAPINVQTAHTLANYDIPYAVTDLIEFTNYLKAIDKRNHRGAICSEFVASVIENNQVTSFFQLQENRWDLISPAMVQFFLLKNFGNPLFKLL